MAGMPSQIASRLLQVSERLRSLLEETYATWQLNVPRAEVLETIAAAGLDGCSQTELAEALGASESNISTLIERMRRDGLLYRMRSRRDRRCSVLLLSDEGRDKLAGMLAARETRLERAMERLSSEDCERLGRLLERWHAALGEESRQSAHPAAVPHQQQEAA